MTPDMCPGGHFVMIVEEAPKLEVAIPWMPGTVPDVMLLWTGEYVLLVGKYIGHNEKFRYRRVVPVAIPSGVMN